MANQLGKQAVFEGIFKDRFYTGYIVRAVNILNDALYSFTFINDSMFLYADTRKPIQFIIGSNLENLSSENTVLKDIGMAALGKAVAETKRMLICHVRPVLLLLPFEAGKHTIVSTVSRIVRWGSAHKINANKPLSYASKAYDFTGMRM